jgi:hypothetical protein
MYKDFQIFVKILFTCDVYEYKFVLPNYTWKKMRKAPEIKSLLRWLETHSASELAAKLGYRTSNTIHAWIKLNRIPARQKVAVLAIIERNDDYEFTKTSDER